MRELPLVRLRGWVQLGFWNVFVKATVHSADGATWLAGKCR